MIPPAGDVDAREFWSALDGGALLASACGICGRRWLPPLATCPYCGARAVTRVPAAVSGALYTWTVIHLAADPVYAAQTPYTVGLVRLDDGVRLYGRVVDVDHDDLREGLRLALRVVKRGDAATWEFAPE